MRHADEAAAIALRVAETAGPEVTPLRPRRSSLPPEPAIPGLAAVKLVSVDGERRTAVVVAGGAPREARLDDVLSPRVLETALARGERVIAQREEDGWVVLGVLRTAPTPGIDEGDEYRIQARRVEIAGQHEVSFVSGAASIVLRAHGFVETVAQDITTRAAAVHKLIGRMLRLN